MHNNCNETEKLSMLIIINIIKDIFFANITIFRLINILSNIIT